MRAMPVLAAILATFGLLVAAAPASASALQITPRPIFVNPGVINRGPRTANRTTFDPAVHGFRFPNSFANNFIPEFDWRTDGLCGGMIFAALDYFNNPGIPIPTQDWEPADGTVLRDYIYARQTNSVVDQNLAQWIELGFNPHGQRSAEFYRWGLEGRLGELRREIDAGRPVPMGMKGCSGFVGCAADHQIIAIGYDVGGYDGNPRSETARQVRIFVYDPNYPGRTMTLMPAPESNGWRYLEPGDDGLRDLWVAWFIEAYSVRTPPTIPVVANGLLLTIGTGGDDLRGTNDNLNVHVLTRTGRTLTFNNVNQRHPWINNSEQRVVITLPDDVRSTDVRGVRLETTSGGGLGGDNWNMEYLTVEGISNGTRARFLHDEGTPLFRFTGDQRVREFLFCPGCS